MIVTEDAEHEARRLEEQARSQSAWLVHHIRHDPELQQETIRQDSLAYGGLIAVGLVLVQSFVGGAPLDRSGMICAVAFGVAIPLLAALVLVNRQETLRRRRTDSRLVAAARAIAQGSAFVGLVAGFWHINWIVGVVVLVSAMVATGVHSAAFTRLELGEMPASRAAEAGDQPATTEGTDT